MAVRFILLVFVFYVICDIVKCDAEGYYWRDFTGEIPSDALAGGSDAEGKPIYIGQVFNLKFLIPAKIYVNDRKAYYEYESNEYTATDNIKILCTQHPEQFEWIETRSEQLGQIRDKQLVIGGFQPGHSTYIGRVKFGSEILVGKAIAPNPPAAGLHITNEGRGIKVHAFQVLSYNPKLNKMVNLESGSNNSDNNNNNNSDPRHCTMLTILMFS